MGGKRVKLITDKNESCNLCCMGVDYVGVITCCVIAYMCPRVKVTVVDFKPEKVALWNTKQFPSNEPGLEEILRKVQNKNLVFTEDCVRAVKGSEIIFISVDVPPLQDRTSDELEVRGPNFAEIEKAARFIAANSISNKIIVEKSSVPVGSCQFIKQILQSTGNADYFEVLSNPDFFAEGTAIHNLLNPDRVVIGGDNSPSNIVAAETLASIYAEWVPCRKILIMDVWSSEISKLCVNAFLAQKLASINAISLMCEGTGADVSEIHKIMKTFYEHGSEFLKPTFGFGGDFLKKDLMCLIYMCEHFGLSKEAIYWREVLELHEYQTKQFFKQILSTFFNTMYQKKVAVWGVTYQKFTTFTNEFPAMELCRKLLEEGAKIDIYDPRVEKRQIIQELNITDAIKEREKSVRICDNPYQAALKAYAIICLTDLDEIKNLDYESIYKDMLKPAYIFDGRLCLPLERLTKIGFVVKAIGRKIPEE